jgi:diguanylate cyclase (GGDEF)-like protein
MYEVRVLANLLIGLLVVVAGVLAGRAGESSAMVDQALHLGYAGTVAVLVVFLRITLATERRNARTDALTGVRNRRGFAEAAEAHLRGMRRDGSPCTVVYLDVDGFKRANDALGHAHGDLVLKGVATTLAKHVRTGDLVTRLGGDEFAVLLAGEQGQQLAARLHEVLAEAARKQHWGVGFSLGAVTFHTPPRSVEEMLRRTDAVMYQAKGQGGRLIHRVA